MTRYIMRLDDASPYRDIRNWDRVEALLDQFGVRPIVGIIPDNQDQSFRRYARDEKFWDRAQNWQAKGWGIAMHGCDHVYISHCSGINPVNARSEFAGLPLGEQEAKIEKGLAILTEHGLTPRVFFAPAHTFDNNTLLALKNKSEIRIISDTVATEIYFRDGFFFIPQQAGAVRRLPLKTVTFCYHPDTMNEADFEELQRFLQMHANRFVALSDLVLKPRRMNLLDRGLAWAYFNLRGYLKPHKEQRI